MKKIEPAMLKRAVDLYLGGFSIKEVCEITGIGKSTIYRELDRLEIPRHTSKQVGRHPSKND